MALDDIVFPFNNPQEFVVEITSNDPGEPLDFLEGDPIPLFEIPEKQGQQEITYGFAS